MLSPEFEKIVAEARPRGWVMEPDALRLLGLAGVPVPRFAWARSRAEALEAAARIGYPVVAKVVSPQILHKSDVDGVRPGIADGEALATAFERFSRLPGFEGAVVAEMLSGRELIVGAKHDARVGDHAAFRRAEDGVQVDGIDPVAERHDQFREFQRHFGQFDEVDSGEAAMA
ncbi:MAG TPA: acetate--CoA ligase family protein, partial [Desulfobacterales bacterium]|nr:acetate--CoA ligase family protein [Desulfobacterales bacterium]